MRGFLASDPAIGVGYFAARAGIALALGALVGLERQWRQREYSATPHHTRAQRGPRARYPVRETEGPARFR